jgi:asparagine N-glycosylation enzyme membrane subunit Stt3
MKKWVCITIPLLIALVLRLYPYLVTGLPFAIDAWALIRNTELILEHTPVNLDNQIFDGYNNYWPANSLFGAIVSEITSLPPLQAMAIFLPITGATTILIFYALVKKIYNTKIAFIASLIFAVAFTHAFFTAGVTKETYANPLYILLMLIFLHPRIEKTKQILLFTITSTTLVLTHHLTTIITIAILSSIALVRLIKATKKGLPANRRDFLLLGILGAATIIDYAAYAHKGFWLTLTYSDWLSMASYQTITFTLALYLISKPSMSSQNKIVITSLGALTLGFVFTVLLVKKPFIAGLPVMPERYLIYDSPYIIIPPLITLGYRYVHMQKQHNALIVPMFWLAVVAALEGYAVFANSVLSIMLANRALNFLHPPLAILAAAGLYRLYKTDKKHRSRKFLKTLTVAAILFIIVLNIYSLYAAISLEEKYLGHSCKYLKQEYMAGKWITTNNANITIAGDWKISHLLKDYFQQKTDHIQALLYLNGKTGSQPQILFIHDQMIKNGYLISYQVLDLPENWTEKTAQLNLIYSNGLASLYAGEDA